MNAATLEVLIVPKSINGAGRPGTWRPCIGRASVIWKAILVCPDCGYEAPIGPHHEIADDGTLTPELACPTPSCGFEKRVKLEGWVPRVETQPRLI
jgi:hypothetical protein